MKRYSSLLIVTLLSLVYCSLASYPLYADTVEFENGQVLEVVILSKNDEMYTAQCNVGVISFSRERVTNLTEAPYEKNRRLLEKWRKGTDASSKTNEPTLASQEQLPTERRIRYGSEWLSEDEYIELKENTKRTWIEKARFAQEKNRTETEDLKDEQLVEKTNELVVQGKHRRSNEANIILKDDEWKHRRTEHFIVFYKNNTLGRIIIDKAEFFFTKIASDLGILRDISDALDKRIDIYVVDSKDTWNSILQGKYLPDTPNGFSKVYKKELFLFVSNDYDIEFVLPHELSHIILRVYTNIKYNKEAPIPLWLYEGFANFQGNVINLSVAEQLLQRSIKNNAHLPLKELLVINNYPRAMDTKTLFYAEATKLIQYIYLTYGRTKFLEFTDVYLKEYYKYASTKKDLFAKDGQELFTRVIDFTFLKDSFTGFTSFEENWLKSILE
ncbi:hypothetical protein ACFL3D_03885 [Candidatus Omnitrophota bacterium]